MVFEDNELVMYKENGKMYSAGFAVNSIMLQHGISPITREKSLASRSLASRSLAKGGSLDDSLNNLAIPAGLYYFDTGLVGQTGGDMSSSTYIDEDYMDDNLYSTLMGLAGNNDNEYVKGTADNEDVELLESENNKAQGKHKKTKKRLTKEKRRKTRKH